MSEAAPATPPASNRGAVLIALDEFMAFHFGMAPNAFPGSLIDGILDELPGPDALRDPGWQAVIMRRLSINETHFLRQSEHFSVLGGLARKTLDAEPTRKYRVWSAACSTGEEVWTLAAALAEQSIGPDRAELFGSDLNPDVVDKARRGECRRWFLRGVAEGAASSWLDIQGEQVRVRDNLRPYARFEPRNLMDTPYPKDWDAIFCRNVMIYLRADAVQQICSAAFDALRPGGAFFTAATDPTPDAGIGFEEVYVGHSRYYRKPKPRPVVAPTPRKASERRSSERARRERARRAEASEPASRTRTDDSRSTRAASRTSRERAPPSSSKCSSPRRHPRAWWCVWARRASVCPTSMSIV